MVKCGGDRFSSSRFGLTLERGCAEADALDGGRSGLRHRRLWIPETHRLRPEGSVGSYSDLFDASNRKKWRQRIITDLRRLGVLRAEDAALNEKRPRVWARRGGRPFALLLTGRFGGWRSDAPFWIQFRSGLSSLNNVLYP